MLVKMGSTIVIALLAVLSVTAPIHGAVLQQDKIQVDEGEGFMVWAFSEEKIENCELKLKRETSELPGRIEQLTNKDDKECGFRVKEVTSEANGLWELTYTVGDIGGNLLPLVTVNPRSVPKCPEVEEDRSLCEVVNKNTNERVNCSADLQIIKDWECKYTSSGSMKPIIQSSATFGKISIDTPSPLTTPIAASSVKFKDISYSSEGSTILECHSMVKPAQNCYVKHLASGRQYSLEEGLQTDKYSSFKTRLYNGLCQFEIMNMDMNDFGVWSMSVDTEKCYFLVRPQESAIIELRTIEDTINLQCARQLLHPLRRCYLVDAEGNYKIKQESELVSGVCEFSKPINNIYQYYCVYNDEMDKDIITKFNVSRVTHELIRERVETLDNGKSIAEIYEINGKPIEHCLIISPQGNMYAIGKDSEPENYSILGTGLDKGHCGVMFNGSAAYGRWTFNVEMVDGKVQTVEYTHEKVQGASDSSP